MCACGYIHTYTLRTSGQCCVGVICKMFICSSDGMGNDKANSFKILSTLEQEEFLQNGEHQLFRAIEIHSFITVQKLKKNDWTWFEDFWHFSFHIYVFLPSQFCPKNQQPHSQWKLSIKAWSKWRSFKAFSQSSSD